MYDYSNSPLETIENVDHEIHLLGLNIQGMTTTGGVMLLFIQTGFISMITAAIISITIWRLIFLYEQRGTPLQYNRNFLSRTKNMKWIGELLRTSSITLSQGIYRE